MVSWAAAVPSMAARAMDAVAISLFMATLPC
jgi:hypothetical protein